MIKKYLTDVTRKTTDIYRKSDVATLRDFRDVMIENKKLVASFFTK